MRRARDVPRRRVLTLGAGLLLACAFPAGASAAQSISISSPTGFPAGGDPTFTTTMTLDPGAGTPSLVTVRLAPGVLSSGSANPSCLTGPPQYTPACQIGHGSASVTSLGLPLSFDAYLVPPPAAADVAGIDLVTGPPQAVTHGEVQLTQVADGNIQTVLRTDLSQLGDEAQFVNGMSITVNGTLGGKPFNRMPTDCNPGATTLTVVYADRTETTTASPGFVPTGCSSLPFNPLLSGTAVKDRHDDGVAVSTVVTQAANEAAGAATTLRLPWPALSPNQLSLGLLGTSTPVGEATVVTPLFPRPLRGLVYFTGAAFTPSLTIRFPPPAAMTLTGNVDLNGHTVTFAATPDVPQTRLTVTLYGGPRALLTAWCAHPSGALGGAFTAQNGAVVSDSRLLTVSGCGRAPAGPRVASARLSGLAAGQPTLRLKLTGGVRGFTISLPAGLSLKGSRGIFISGTRVVVAAGRRLRVTLRRASAVVGVRIGPPALREAGRLRHRPPRLKLSIALTGIRGGTVIRTLSL